MHDELLDRFELGRNQINALRALDEEQLRRCPGRVRHRAGKPRKLIEHEVEQGTLASLVPSMPCGKPRAVSAISSFRLSASGFPSGCAARQARRGAVEGVLVAGRDLSDAEGSTSAVELVSQCYGAGNGACGQDIAGETRPVMVFHGLGEIRMSAFVLGVVAFT